MKKIILAFASLVFVACTPSSTETSESTAAEMDEVVQEVASTNGVTFVNIQDGATLKSPFLLEMGVVGMEVEPKGAPREGYGHHHLLVNDNFAPEGTVIVADETHIHYGGGQTSDSVTLAPGDYQLTLQFADGMHVSYGKLWSKSINITVE